jgi:CubicO group peptidase (beta-lactamase class C family)
MRLLVFPALAALLFLPARPAPAQLLDTSYVRDALRDWKVPGAAIALVRQNRIESVTGFGVRKIGSTQPVDGNTVFAIGSNTKAFTSTALAMLVDEKKIGWDDPVQRHLPWLSLPEPWVHELTIREILSHRSGYGSYQGDMLWVGSKYDRREVLRRMALLTPATARARAYAYSNIMYILAGELFPAAAARSWEQFISDRLLTPLVMTRTTTSVSALAALDNVASPHEARGAAVKALPFRVVDNGAPAGGINSTARDLAEWLRFQLADGLRDSVRLVSEPALRETKTPQTIIRGTGPARLFASTHFRAYGFGWVIQDYRGRKIVWHIGGIGGMKSVIALVPEEQLGIVILTNRGDTMLPEALAWRAIDSAIGNPVRDWSKDYLAMSATSRADDEAAERKLIADRVPGTKPTAQLAAYAGRYANNIYGELTVTLRDGALAIESALDLNGQLMHWQSDSFRYSYDDGPGNFVDFTVDTTGVVTGLRINRSLVFLRVK